MCDRSVYGLEGLLEHGEGTPPALEFVHVHGEIGMLALEFFLFSGVSQMLVLTAAEHRKLVQNKVPMELHLCCQPVSAEQSLSSQTTVSPSLNSKFALKLAEAREHSETPRNVDAAPGRCMCRRKSHLRHCLNKSHLGHSAVTANRCRDHCRVAVQSRVVIVRKCNSLHGNLGSKARQRITSASLVLPFLALLRIADKLRRCSNPAASAESSELSN